VGGSGSCAAHSSPSGLRVPESVWHTESRPPVFEAWSIVALAAPLSWGVRVWNRLDGLGLIFVGDAVNGDAGEGNSLSDPLDPPLLH
jgi:hypothetical protein